MSRASNLAGFSTSISPPSNLSVGIVTATSFFGSGSGLTGVGIGSTGNVNTSGIITATSFFGSGSGLTGVGIGSTGNVNTSGIITATSFVGSGSGLTGVGIGSTGSINTSGIITATSFVGSGSGNATGLSGSPNLNVGVLTATTINVPPIPITFSPAIGATGVTPSSNIIITFDQQITKGTGNITLRANSAGGTAFSTIGVSSSSVTISGGAVTIDPPANIGAATTTFVVVDAGAFSGLTTTSINALINTYSFTTRAIAVGDSYEGGFLICKASPLRWVVSPRSAEVSRTWYLRNDANTTAQSISGCTGWFVPTVTQLQNPGFVCVSFWDSYSSAFNWSSTDNGSPTSACYVNFGSGFACSGVKPSVTCVRAFRCVTY